MASITTTRGTITVRNREEAQLMLDAGAVTQSEFDQLIQAVQTTAEPVGPTPGGGTIRQGMKVYDTGGTVGVVAQPFGSGGSWIVNWTEGRFKGGHSSLGAEWIVDHSTPEKAEVTAAKEASELAAQSAVLAGTAPSGDVAALEDTAASRLVARTGGAGVNIQGTGTVFDGQTTDARVTPTSGVTGDPGLDEIEGQTRPGFNDIPIDMVQQISDMLDRINSGEVVNEFGELQRILGREFAHLTDEVLNTLVTPNINIQRGDLSTIPEPPVTPSTTVPEVPSGTPTPDVPETDLQFDPSTELSLDTLRRKVSQDVFGTLGGAAQRAVGRRLQRFGDFKGSGIEPITRGLLPFGEQPNKETALRDFLTGPGVSGEDLGDQLGLGLFRALAGRGTDTTGPSAFSTQFQSLFENQGAEFPFGSIEPAVSAALQPRLAGLSPGRRQGFQRFSTNEFQNRFAQNPEQFGSAFDIFQDFQRRGFFPTFNAR